MISGERSGRVIQMYFLVLWAPKAECRLNPLYSRESQHLDGWFLQNRATHTKTKIDKDCFNFKSCILVCKLQNDTIGTSFCWLSWLSVFMCDDGMFSKNQWGLKGPPVNHHGLWSVQLPSTARIRPSKAVSLFNRCVRQAVDKLSGFVVKDAKQTVVLPEEHMEEFKHFPFWFVHQFLHGNTGWSYYLAKHKTTTKNRFILNLFVKWWELLQCQ